MEDSDDCCSLETLLHDNNDIYRVYPDYQRDRIHLSVTAKEFSSVCTWLDQELAKYPFLPTRYRNPAVAPSLEQRLHAR